MTLLFIYKMIPVELFDNIDCRTTMISNFMNALSLAFCPVFKVVHLSSSRKPENFLDLNSWLIFLETGPRSDDINFDRNLGLVEFFLQ